MGGKAGDDFTDHTGQTDQTDQTGQPNRTPKPVAASEPDKRKGSL